MSGFSVLILTLNEARNIESCIASVAGSDDIVVLDSGSTDATVELAASAGARVYTRAFDTFARQRNHADTTIAFRHPWVLHLDCDERATPELNAECADAAASGAGLDGYYAAPRMLWRGHWVPHCTDYPAWQARFVRVPGFRFIDVGHGQREAPDMRMGFLAANYYHDLFGEGVDGWLSKHRKYARAEARQFLADRGTIHGRDVFARDRLTRRRALKHFSYLLPCRPLARFAYQYLARGGFLDGRAGLEYCRLLATYERYAADELRQLRRMP